MRIVLGLFSSVFGLKCFHCSDNDCEIENSGSLEECSNEPGTWVCGTTFKYGIHSRLCLNLADSFEREMVIYEEGVCDDSVRASPYCNKTDVEFDHLFADKKESNRFLGLYTKCQITFGEKECFHYCSTDGCNNRHSRNPLEPVVVDYEIVEPEMEIMTPEIFDETTVLMPEDVAAPITVQVEVTDGISRLKNDYSHSAKVIMSTVLTCLLLV